MNSIKKNQITDSLFNYLGIASTMFGLIMLAIFIANILIDGIARIDWRFLTSLPSRKPEKAGILTAWTGTVWILGLTAVFAIPLSVATGIYLEEYGKRNKLGTLIEINITNLAGVPSIIYGLLGLEIFERILHFVSSLMAGAFTLALLILPIIIVATREAIREAIRAVPNSLREASYGMGATKWQTVSHQGYCLPLQEVFLPALSCRCQGQWAKRPRLL